MTLSGTFAYAGGSTDQYGTWNSGGPTYNVQAGGSNIANNQVTLNNQWSTISGKVDSVAGDAAVQGAAAGNLIDITTMNDTRVQNNQIVGPQAAIGSDISTSISNLGGSVGLSNQVVCNGASISTDPTLTQINSNQECHATDPSALSNLHASNITGDVSMQSSALGNTFEADSNAPNMPIVQNQLNNSMVASTLNATIHNVNGSVGLQSSAIGNQGQILHYSTN